MKYWSAYLLTLMSSFLTHAMDEKAITLASTTNNVVIQQQDLLHTLLSQIKTSLPNRPSHGEIDAFRKIETIAKEQKKDLSKLTNYYTVFEGVYQKYLKPIKSEIQALKTQIEQAQKEKKETSRLDNELKAKEDLYNINLIKFRYYVIPASEEAKKLNNKDLEYYNQFLVQKQKELAQKQRVSQETESLLIEKTQQAEGIKLQLAELHNAMAAKPVASWSEEAQKIASLTAQLKPIEVEIKKQKEIKAQTEKDIKFIDNAISDSTNKIDEIKAFIDAYDKRKTVFITMLEEKKKEVSKCKEEIEHQLKAEQQKLAVTTLENKPSIESNIKQLEANLVRITTQMNEVERCIRKKDEKYGILEAASYEAKRTISNLGSSIVSYFK
ncbi:MAG: hypothetical protein ACOYT8_05485 [Candidatus Dependentiae bacterium]